MKLPKAILLAVGFGLLLVGPSVQAAAVPAAAFSKDPPDPSPTPIPDTLRMGEDFNVLHAEGIMVFALGYFDANGDGLSSAHDVSLWQLDAPGSSTGTILATVTVPAGTVATLEEGYRFVNLPTPLILPAGTAGSVVAYLMQNPGDTFGDNPIVPNEVDLIWAGHDRYDFGANMASGLPTFQSTDFNAHASASFLYANVPEPSTWFLLAMGLGGLAFARRRVRLG